jgi:hypothetical protein
MTDLARRMDNARDSRSGMAFATLANASDLARFPARIMVTVDGNYTLRGVDGVDVVFPLRASVEYDLTPRQIVAVPGGGAVIGIFGSPIIP